MSRPPIDSLPPEMIDTTNKFLDVNALVRFSCVSKEYHSKALAEIHRRLPSMYFGYGYAFIIDKHGQVFCCGNNSSGAMGYRMKPYIPHFEKVLEFKGDKITSIASNHEHTLFLSITGAVYSTGSGDNGELGHGQYSRDLLYPLKIKALRDYRIVSIGVLPRSSFFLTDKGDLLSCGHKDECQLIDRPRPEIPDIVLIDLDIDNNRQLIPAPVEAVSGTSFSSMYAGDLKLYLLTPMGQVYSCGNGEDGQLGHGDESDIKTPQQITSLDGIRIKSVVIGSYNSFFITGSGEVYYSGDKWHLSNGMGDGKAFVPELLTCMKGLNVTSIVEAELGSKVSYYFLTTEGRVYFLSRGSSHRDDEDDKLIVQQLALSKDIAVQSISSGDEYIAIQTVDGAWYAKGAEVMRYLPSEIASELYDITGGVSDAYEALVATNQQNIDLWSQPRYFVDGVEQFRLIVPSPFAPDRLELLDDDEEAKESTAHPDTEELTP
ncbi:MAG: hypothetical protein P1U34_07280 [Coxiellaceae bacterium]|nr:hypothetical protein [Coxiellaceae bacterium]